MSVTHKLFCVLFALLAPIILTSATSSAQSSSAVTPSPSASSDQKAGSVLIYNYFGASATTAEAEETLINLTNNHTSRSAAVHLFIVDGSSGAVKDSFVTLAPNQTYTLLASSLASRFRGYLIAVAVDSQTGCPTSFNYLTGDEYIRIAAGHTAILNAVAFAALYNGNLGNCGLRATNAPAEVATTQIDLDGVSYDAAGSLLGLDSFRHPTADSSTLLIVNRLGGDLAQGLRPIGDFNGVVYNSSGEGFRFAGQTASPQLRQELSDLLSANPNSLLPDLGRLGRLQLRATEETAITGAAISLNRNTAPSPTSDSSAALAPSPIIIALNGGRNLRHLAPAKASFIIPVSAPPIDPDHKKSADVAIDMTVSPNSAVTADDELTYTITITNKGPDAAESVVVHDELPAALKLVSCTATGKGVCGGTRTSPNITFDSLDAGASATVTLVTKVLPPVADLTSALAANGQAIVNVATVESVTPDPNEGNNKAVARVMNTAADVAVSMAASPNPVAPGAELIFTITVANKGPQAAQKVTVTDSLPSSVTLSSCTSTSGGVCAGTRTNPVITFASLDAGASATITLVTKVNAPVPVTAATLSDSSRVEGNVIINTVLARSATFDPTQDNNLAAVKVALSLPQPFAVGGTVNNSTKGGLARVKISFSVVSGTGTAPAPVATDAFGRWSQSGFQAGTVYRVTPGTVASCTAFTPASRDVKEAARGVDFTTTCR